MLGTAGSWVRVPQRRKAKGNKPAVEELLEVRSSER